MDNKISELLTIGQHRDLLRREGYNPTSDVVGIVAGYPNKKYYVDDKEIWTKLPSGKLIALAVYDKRGNLIKDHYATADVSANSFKHKVEIYYDTYEDVSYYTSSGKLIREGVKNYDITAYLRETKGDKYVSEVHNELVTQKQNNNDKITNCNKKIEENNKLIEKLLKQNELLKKSQELASKRIVELNKKLEDFPSLEMNEEITTFNRKNETIEETCDRALSLLDDCLREL